ncbi:hypothetical protein SAMN04489860_1333 [Paraoerskovia marina]|uniref:Uncharacterized protein n=1 Tax=Paraoerskovia marina TaxID=545619 RepID=A0A1H1RE84_9CELL|nr:DUF6069 family protein [Paraoerskovia marina]SDS33992.1 hypothetical protein SAMN04489860_1333 [Paraoerskovia marina]
MSYPDEGPEPTRRIPRVPANENPPASYPVESAGPQQQPAPTQEPEEFVSTPSTPVIDAKRFVGGTLATAAVAALVGYVATVVLESVFNLDVIAPPNPFGASTDAGAFAVAGALLTFLAAGVLVLLALIAPRPRLFFGWLMFLVVALTASLPFAWTDDTITAAFTSALNLLIGIAVWSLLTGTAAKTIRPRRSY